MKTHKFVLLLSFTFLGLSNSAQENYIWTKTAGESQFATWFVFIELGTKQSPVNSQQS